MSNLPPENVMRRWLAWGAAALFLACTAAVFLLPANCTFGGSITDVTHQFLAWRAFAASSIRSGHFPYWNPYTFAGQPFLGEAQSALLYPPNVIFLVLPICRAINLSFVLHLFILGVGMYRFAVRRGLGVLGSGVCAFLLPLSGPVFPCIFAGHLPNLCTLAWAPWLLAGLEDWFNGRNGRGLLWACMAAAMQILGGHMQYVYYTAIAAGLYAVARSLLDPEVRGRALPGAVAAFGGGAVLAAAQLIPEMTAFGEGVRQSKLVFAHASMFSLPPENLLTALAPGLLGTYSVDSIYWGRCFPWEMILFAGVSGLVLAAVAFGNASSRRDVRLELVLAAVLLVVALGANTPVYRALYEFVPGFGRFRGVSKFTFPAMIFFVLAVGRGADALAARRIPRGRLAGLILTGGVAATLLGCFLWEYPAAISRFVRLEEHSGESYLPATVYDDDAFRRTAGTDAGKSLLAGGTILLVLGDCLHSARRKPILRWAPLALLPLEMLSFAHWQFAVSTMDSAAPPPLRDYIAARPGDYRIYNAYCPNNGFLMGKSDIGGFDPLPLRRYAEFAYFFTKNDPDLATGEIVFPFIPTVMQMLRFRYAFLPTPGNPSTAQIMQTTIDPMGQVQLISNVRVISGRDAIFAAMNSSDFNPRATVILEKEPHPAPLPGSDPGVATAVGQSINDLTVDVIARNPAILLITDLYSRDWHAEPLPGSTQAAYEIMPANYILRAIPLNAGRHIIHIYYKPAGFALGIAVSIAAGLLWLGAILAAPGKHHPFV